MFCSYRGEASPQRQRPGDPHPRKCANGSMDFTQVFFNHMTLTRVAGVFWRIEEDDEFVYQKAYRVDWTAKLIWIQTKFDSRQRDYETRL